MKKYYPQRRIMGRRTDSFKKTLMLGKIGGGRRRGRQKDEMVGWYHRLNGREFEWTLGVGDGQGGLACCSSWGCKESDTIEWLNWNHIVSFPSQSAANSYFLWNEGHLMGFYVLESMSVFFYYFKKDFWGFPDGSVVKNLPASVGDTGSVVDPRRSHMFQSN